MQASRGAVIEAMNGLVLELVEPALVEAAHPDDEDKSGVCESCWWAKRLDTHELVLLWGWDGLKNWSIHRETPDYARHKEIVT